MTITPQNTPSLEQLLASLKREAGAGKGPPPVEQWNPAYCGEVGFEILKDGTWLHQGARITREPMKRLFASILRKDADGETYLVTPVEKILVKVEDAPFLAVRVDRAGEGRGSGADLHHRGGRCGQSRPRKPDPRGL
ncbi:MAG: DUF1285 domain-containing protein [Terricaulis sp.]|nr:DUF1285 domain-containing protein [Terricaulis sp.]